MEWFKDMTDSQISAKLLELSQTAIQIMQEGRKGEALDIRKELIEKGKELREHVSNIKGGVSQEVAEYYEMFIYDMEITIIETGEKMLKIFKEKRGA